MPELPEVETVKRGLQATVEGRRFIYVETRRGDLRIPFPEDFENRLTGRRVQRLWRRAKYILADLDGGETLVIHLGNERAHRCLHQRQWTWTWGISLRDSWRRNRTWKARPRLRHRCARKDRLDHRRFGLMNRGDRSPRIAQVVQGPWRRATVQAIRCGVSKRSAAE